MSVPTNDVSDYITFTFMWHSLSDACPQCANLNGRIWEGQSIYQDTLWDPIWGDIWDLNIDMSLTHGGTGVYCRCQLEVQAHFDWSKIKELNLLSQVNMQSEPANETAVSDTSTGSYRTTTFEDIGSSGGT